MRALYFSLCLGLVLGLSVNAQEFVSVCERTHEVRYELQWRLRKNCDEIAETDLAALTFLTVPDRRGLSFDLKCGDFSGMLNLNALSIPRGSQPLPQCLFNPLFNLETLVMRSHSGARRLPPLPLGIFDPLVNLVELDLANNNMWDIPKGLFGNLTHLKTLDLSNNSITELRPGQLSHLVNLQILSLSRNSIEKLTSDSFIGLGNLQKLYLTSNKLSELPADVFKFLPRLREISLSGNLIEQLPEEVFWPLQNIEAIFLQISTLQTIPDFSFVNLNKLMLISLLDAPLTKTGKGALYGLGKNVSVDGLPPNFDVDRSDEEWRSR